MFLTTGKTATMGEGSGGSNTADSYIGSLISLTSKSEIRYEGILYTVDTENSNIALQNVRSYGTEGRKKDGPQILAGDKVYDYIIFRGSDIKDLQVKSSPAVQTPMQPPSDPAIISLQSQYGQPTTVPPAYVAPQVGPLVDGSPSSTYSGVSASSFRGSVHSLYQTAGSVGSWGIPPPGSNGTGLAVPMYWQGFYRPSTAQTHIHHHVPQPPPSLPAPPHLFQLGSRSYPRLEVSSSSRGTAIDLQASEPYVTSASAPVTSTPPSVISTGSFGIPQAPVMLMPSSPPAASGTRAQAVEGDSDIGGASATFMAATALNLTHGVSAVITPPAKIPWRVVTTLQHTQAQPTSYVSTSNLLASSVPAVSTVNPSLSPRSQSEPELSSAYSTPPTKTVAPCRIQKLDRKGTDNSTSASQAFNRFLEKEHQLSQPLLPLPTSTVQGKHTIQGNASPGMSSNYVRRGRPRGGSGKGVVLLHVTQHFAEDFDFTAMNKKFNKDEVWGELGGRGECREKVAEADEGASNCDETSQGHSDGLVLELQKKPVYVKEDFFDSLSCDSLDRGGGRAERTKFSEQRRIDTETFGNFPLRSRASRGRGLGRRGGYGGAYYSPQYTSGGRSTAHVKGRGPA